MAYVPKDRGEPRPYEAVAYRDRRVHLTQGGDRFLRVEGGEALDVAVGLGDLLRCDAARADRLVEFAERRRGGACYRMVDGTDAGRHRFHPKHQAERGEARRKHRPHPPSALTRWRPVRAAGDRKRGGWGQG